LAENKGVTVFCETGDKDLLPIATELLACGRRLADDLGEELHAVLIGSEIKEPGKKAIMYGADKAYIIDAPLLQNYHMDTYLAALEKVVTQTVPRILLAGNTSVGRDLVPRLASRLNTAIFMDCVELAIDPESKQVQFTKPIYGGNVYGNFTSDSCLQMATIRAKVMTPLEPDSSKNGDVIIVDFEFDREQIRTRLLEKIPEVIEGIRLEEANVVVSGGRGVGNAEGFVMLDELAKLLGGAVGASRPPCDNGWVPSSMQIGLTGKIINPDLYIAIALSGSSQHMSGCFGSKNIVAINKDPEANIFRQAKYGVVGDWKKVLPSFVNKLKEIMKA